MGGGFYFDRASGTCKTYGSSQCRGSANYFSLRGCLETCPNARPEVDACGSDFDCVVVDTACCASCEPVSQSSLIAVNALRAGDYRDPCPPVACAPCPPVDELLTTRQYFVPFCSAGKCVVRDIRGSEYTSCSVGSDCVLRDGAECCEGCDGRGLVALNRSGGGRTCDNAGCDACTPIIPVEYRALCDGSQCRVTRTVDASAR
jgi:hypothetical protein